MPLREIDHLCARINGESGDRIPQMAKNAPEVEVCERHKHCLQIAGHEGECRRAGKILKKGRKARRKEAIEETLALLRRLDRQYYHEVHEGNCNVQYWRNTRERPDCTCEYGRVLAELEAVK